MNEHIDQALTGILPAILLLSALSTLPISLALLRIYRRAVIRTMGNNTSLATPIPKTSEQSPQFTETTASTTIPHSTTRLYTRLLQAPWHHAIIYTGGGLGYAIVMTTALHLVDDMPFEPGRFLYLIWLYLWPAVITLNLIVASHKQTIQRSVLGYFGILILISILVSGDNHTPTTSGILAIGLWSLFNLPTTLLLLTVMHQKIRAVGPLVLTGMMFIITGLHSFYWLGDSQVMWIGRLTELTSIPIRYSIFFSVLLSLFLFSVLGWICLQWIRKRYEQKLISDQSLQLTSIWASFALVNTIGLATDKNQWVLSGILAFTVFLSISKKLLANVNATTEARGINLLLLRVFALGPRSEKLFHSLALHWRHIGSIQMIAGPDLVNTTIEPHELLDFVTGKLARRFIDSPQTLELRLQEMDLKRDHDHRYRINNFFCYDNTWKLTLISLLKTNDVVLMDLRSFTPQRAGCIFEINTLISLVPLEKIILLVDSTTDHSFLQKTLQTAWRTKSPHSPNTPKSLDQLQIFRFENTPTQLSGLLRTLVGVGTTLQLQGT